MNANLREDLRLLENNDMYWYEIDWWFYWQYKADNVITGCERERVHVDVFMCLRPRACTRVHMFMWIWIQAIIKVLSLTIWGPLSQLCHDKASAPWACWNSTLQMGTHKNRNMSCLPIAATHYVNIHSLVISSSSLNSMFYFSLFGNLSRSS